MPLRLRSAGGGSVLLKPPVAQATDVSMEVPGYEGAKLLTNKTPGCVLQVVQAVKSDVFAATSTAWVDVPGLSVSLTPLNASSKILVQTDVSISGSSSTAANTRLVRDSTAIYVGDAAGSRPRGLGQNYTAGDYGAMRTGGVFLDSPNTTSLVTYKVQMLVSGGTLYVNRTTGDRDTAQYDGRSASSITLMEIAA